MKCDRFKRRRGRAANVASREWFNALNDFGLHFVSKFNFAQKRTAVVSHQYSRDMMARRECESILFRLRDLARCELLTTMFMYSESLSPSNRTNLVTTTETTSSMNDLQCLESRQCRLSLSCLGWIFLI
jgi:hypothetical protein